MLTLLGCSSRPLDFGEHPDFEWWTDHETGDLRDWQAGAEPQGFTFSETSELKVVSGPAHSGAFALRVRGKSPTAAGWTTAVVARNGPLPTEAYYSAWYYMPVAIEPRDYWIYFLFRSRTAPFDQASAQNEYGLSFRSDAGGALKSVLAGTHGGPESPIGDVSVPIGEWFQISAYLRIANDDAGALRVWQNGTLIFDVAGPTAASSYVEWLVGGVVEGLAREPVDLYVDDAAITRRLLGPLEPAFSRQ